MPVMNVIINGKEVTVSNGSISALAADFAPEGYIAVSKNNSMIPRSRTENETVKDGDSLDFLKAVGGG